MGKTKDSAQLISKTREAISSQRASTRISGAPHWWGPLARNVARISNQGSRFLTNT
jgi:hypothetical protein